MLRCTPQPISYRFVAVMVSVCRSDGRLLCKYKQVNLKKQAQNKQSNRKTSQKFVSLEK